MKRLATALAVLCFATQLHAATVRFTGSTTPSTGPAAPVTGTSVFWELTYTPAAMGGGASAVITAATLQIGAETWNTLLGPSNQLTIIEKAGNDDILVASTFAGSSPSGNGSTVSSLSMTITGVNDVGAAPDATEANITSLIWNSDASGSLFLFDGSGGSTINFSGVATPEPSSVALLGGLALFGGVQVVRRRKKSATEAKTV